MKGMGTGPRTQNAKPSKWRNWNRARARRPAGSMSGPETLYGARIALLERAGEVLWSRYKPGTLRLANGSRYEPDWGYVDQDGCMVYVEVKGTAGWKSDHSGKSRTKWLEAGDLYWWARFEVAIQATRRGGFRVETYEPREDRSGGTA